MSAELEAVRLAEVLRTARARDASDVHLTPGCVPIFRVDGRLEPMRSLSMDAPETARMAAHILNTSARVRFDATGDATVTYRCGESGAFRVHAYQTSRGCCLAIRLLALRVPPLEALQLPKIVTTLSEKQTGLIIFAGPTGSGKTTAMAAVIDRVNQTQSKHIITIEDPVEYQHESKRSIVSQREVGSDVSTFAEAIVGALRSDPDIVLVGEMRDGPTMKAALTAAETGHLVVATLHTADAPQTIDRIIDAFHGSDQAQVRVQLAQSLLGVICLRLVNCLGRRGRRAAVEVLVASDAVRNIIRESKSHQLRNQIATGRYLGMQTLESHLSELVSRHEIGLSEAQAATDRPNEILGAEAVVNA
ncbi:MAG: PilT/PilU family type 4a pilus ATPase [Candidatus Eremiobacteraeota bacterium]|nr:PilT/PilU family type 4a pilus ATPase [Candidatus Eremiobacteraeota bacterium]